MLIDAIKIMDRANQRYGPHCRFDPWTYAGNHNARLRAEIMTALLDAPKRVPQSKCGVNELRRQLYKAAGITGSYPAEREDNFVAYCQIALAEVAAPPQPAFALTGQPKPVWQRGDFASAKATQRPLFSGLGCLPGQGDLFATDGEG